MRFAALFLTVALAGQALAADTRYDDRARAFLACFERAGAQSAFEELDTLRVHTWMAKDGFAYVEELLGWHLTWSILIDVSGETVTVYETFHPEAPRPFGRMAIPAPNIRAAEECGNYQDRWQGAFPEVSYSLETEWN